MYSVPAPPYDIHSKDFSHSSYVNQFNGNFNTGSGEPFYPQQLLNGLLAPTTSQNPHAAFYHQSPDGGLASAFQPNGFAFDGRLAPAFQYNDMLPLSRNTPSSSSQSSSFGATLTPPRRSLGNIPQLYPQLEDNLPPPDLPPARRRRTRGPNKRPPGTGFSDLLDKLPEEVRVAMKEYYPDCRGCGEQPPPEEEGRENSSRQKHIFSNEHCRRLSEDIREQLPNFVCPAFVALHDQCLKARPGRYDSAERHCRSCPGFQEINSKYKVSPVEITKREHSAIKDYRSNNNPSAETARLVTTPLYGLLVMMVNAGMPLEAISDVSGTMKVAASELLEQPLPLGRERW